jgi:hypothetical protein
VSPVPRLRRYYEGATTSRPRIPGPLWFRSQAPHAPPVFVLAEALPLGVEDAQRAWNRDQPAVPVPAISHVDAKRDLTGSLAIHPMPLPCSKTPAEPPEPRLWRSRRCCPRATHAEGLRTHIISRLTQGFSIRCLRFTSDVAVPRARLASGWRAAPLPGGGRTLWIASKGFRIYIPFSFPGLSLSQGSSTPSLPSAGRRPCWPISAATPIAWRSRTTA